MRVLGWIASLCVGIFSAYAVEIKREGLIPIYKPYEIKIISWFLPYNPTVLVVGDRIADFTAAFGRAKERANIYGFTASRDDFKKLEYLREQMPNLRPYFGLLSSRQDGLQLFYSTRMHDIPNEFYYHFSGSVLQPTDRERAFLFGPSYRIPLFNSANFFRMHQLDTIDLIYLDCGGNELEILKSIEEYLTSVTIVCLKTYHQNIRKGVVPFQQVHEFMTKHAYELLSHHIYDDVIGDALYIKTNYVSAVFRNKEL